MIDRQDDIVNPLADRTRWGVLEWCAWIKNRILTFGIIGIIHYVFSLKQRYIINRTFSGNKSHTKPVRGITLIGNFSKTNSLSKTTRDLAILFHRASIPLQTYDMSDKVTIPKSEQLPFLTKRELFDIMKYDHVILSFELENIRLPIPRTLKTCMFAFWEFESGFKEVHPYIGKNYDLLALSDFNYHLFNRIKQPHRKVYKVLYPFNFSFPKESKINIRNKFGIPKDAFMVFFNFDYSSSYNRKNPDGCIKAFSKAFSNTQDAILVFKTMSSNKYPEAVSRIISLCNELNIQNKFISIDEYLSENDLSSLTASCDVYMSLHRGEGFGIGIAEAMYLSKPVIVTNYSAPTEFCNSSNTLPIRSKLIPTEQSLIDHTAYLWVKEWADPDIDDAANALRRCYNDASFRKYIGLRASKFINEYFSVKKFTDSVNEFLNT